MKSGKSTLLDYWRMFGGAGAQGVQEGEDSPAGELVRSAGGSGGSAVGSCSTAGLDEVILQPGRGGRGMVIFRCAV